MNILNSFSMFLLALRIYITKFFYHRQKSLLYALKTKYSRALKGSLTVNLKRSEYLAMPLELANSRTYVSNLVCNDYELATNMNR